MPEKQAEIERVRVQVSIPKNLFAAALDAAGGAERGMSGVICEALARSLGVPYTPPRRGRPAKKADPATAGG